MDINTRQIEDTTVVDIAGRLDSTTSGAAYDQLVAIAKSGSKKVAINLGQLEYLSSAGLRMILVMVKLLKGSGGSANICHAHGVVKEVLETSGFDHLVSLHDDEVSALQSLNN